MFKAVIFDMDGVVVLSERAHWHSFNALWKPLGLYSDWEEWKQRYTGTGSFHIISDMFRRHGITAGEVKEWVKKRNVIFREYVSKHPLRPVPGFRRFLSFLRKNRIKCMVVSGAQRENVRILLEKVGMTDLEYMGIDDFKERKPAPAGFLMAGGRMGVRPGECLVFEDSAPGINSARAAGMTCIGLATSLPEEKLKELGVFKVIANYNELKQKEREALFHV